MQRRFREQFYDSEYLNQYSELNILIQNSYYS